MRLPFKSIRGKVSALAVVVSAIAMAAVVAAVALATWQAVERTIVDALDRRLDSMEELLQQGVPSGFEFAGDELVQVIDANGQVVATNLWAEGYAAISAGGLEPGEERDQRSDALEFERVAEEEVPATATVQAPSEEPASEPAVQRSAAPSAKDSGYGSGAASSDGDSGYDDGGSGYGGSAYGAAVAWLMDLFRPAAAYATSAGSSSAGDASGAVAGATRVSAQEVLGEPGPYLVRERGVETPEGVVTVAAMVSLAPAVETAQTVAAILACVMGCALVLVAIISWLLVSRTLRPVDAMRQRAETISYSDLEARLPVPEGDADLARLANTFNDLLARLEASAAQQRRFVSDASHELKTPVAAIRVMLETMRDHPDAVDLDSLVDDVMSENERVAGIVGDLLLLARQDEGIVRLDKEPLDMMDVLYEEAAALRSHSSIDVDMSGVEPVVCTADRDALSHCVRNLLDNAARYAAEQVKVSCCERDGRVAITVSDDGPGIPEKDRERVFGRFVRLEEGRSRKEGSTGLGLAVVRTIAEQHGGTARFVDGELGGATCVVEIEA